MGDQASSEMMRRQFEMLAQMQQQLYFQQQQQQLMMFAHQGHHGDPHNMSFNSSMTLPVGSATNHMLPPGWPVSTGTMTQHV